MMLGAASSRHSDGEMAEYVERVLNYAAVTDTAGVTCESESENTQSAQRESKDPGDLDTELEEQKAEIQPGFSKSSHVFLDVAQPDAPEGDGMQGRLVFQLFEDVAPRPTLRCPPPTLAPA